MTQTSVGDLKHEAEAEVANEGQYYRRLAGCFDDLESLERSIPVPGSPSIQFGSVPGELEAFVKAHRSITTAKPDPSRYLTDRRLKGIKLGPLPTMASLKKYTELPKFKDSIKLVPLTTKNLMEERARLLKPKE